MSAIRTWFGKYWWIVFMPFALVAVVWGVLAWLKRNTDINFSVDNSILSLLPQIQGRYAAREAGERGIGVYLSVPLTTIIKNDNPVPLNLKNMSFDLAYEGESIMRTSADSKGVASKAISKEETAVTDNVDILINGKTIKFLKSLIQKEKPVIDYDVQTRLYNIPYSFRGSKVMSQQDGKIVGEAESAKP